MILYSLPGVYSDSYTPDEPDGAFYCSGDVFSEDYTPSFGLINIGGISSATDYYLNKYVSLVTSEHADKLKYVEWVKTLIKPFCDMQDIISSIPWNYSLENAVGNQLDVLGQWIGINRNLQEPLVGVYFSLDMEGIGLDQGVIFNPNIDSEDGFVQLDDETYLTLLKAKIVYNQWDGSSNTAMSDMASVFSPHGYSFYIQDNGDGTMYEGLIGGISPPPILLQQMLITSLFDFRPAGIKLNYFWQSDSNPVFALDVENSYFGGLDNGSFATIH